jgi:hypothetical protein
MTEIRKQNQVALRERLLKAQQGGELPKGINVDDYTRYLSTIVAGLSIHAANGSTETELSQIIRECRVTVSMNRDPAIWKHLPPGSSAFRGAGDQKR